MATIKSLLDHVCTGGVLKIGDLAQVTRTTRRNVVRWRYRSATVRRDVEERLLELRAVVDLARRAMPDRQARTWLRSPQPDLDGQRPLDLVSEGAAYLVIDGLTAILEAAAGVADDAEDGLLVESTLVLLGDLVDQARHPVTRGARITSSFERSFWISPDEPRH